MSETVSNESELRLAQACVSGDADARATFLQTYSRAMRQSVFAVIRQESFANDVLQDIVVMLLDGVPDHPPRLRSYAGHGSLEGWLRVTCTREAIRRAKQHTARRPIDSDPAIFAASDATPELKALLRESAPLLVEAIRQVLRELPDEDRLTLKLAIIDGVSIDKIAVLHGCHRATAARRVAALRENVLAATRQAIAQRLRLDEEDVDSFIRTAREAVDTSFASAFSG